MSHPQVHLTRFLYSPSRGSICGPHGPAAGLSHAPSAQAAQARCSSHNPSPAGSAGRPFSSSLRSASTPLIVCLTACLHAWILSLETSYGQTSVNSTASPRERSPCSANIWRTTRTCLTLHLGAEMGNEGKSTVCAENMGFCYKLVIGKRKKLF